MGKYLALQVFCRATILFLPPPPLVRPYSQPFSKIFYTKRGVLPECAEHPVLSRKRHRLASLPPGEAKKKPWRACLRLR